ncbi:FLYWCH-type zinc finger-containing protein 1-like [Macrobrachium rosenbergii]|uniref:FLYWCH-type zinc finger-containing protein 1-like n=1 Tax=Macrobrachium rosenbergii TaxID=79674 RepID=UPI0034D3D927
MDISFIESEKGKNKLCLDGYPYIKAKAVNSKIYWKCEMSKKRKCCARIITVDDSITKQNGNNNYAGDAGGIEAAKAMEKVQEHAMNSRDTPRYVASCASIEVSGAAAMKLPSVENMKRTIRKKRCRTCFA